MEEARARGWDTLKNGELLDAAEDAGFDVFVTTDRNLRCQQNLRGRASAIVVLSKTRWTLIKPVLPVIASAIASAVAGSVVEVEIPPTDGHGTASRADRQRR